MARRPYTSTFGGEADERGMESTGGVVHGEHPQMVLDHSAASGARTYRTTTSTPANPTDTVRSVGTYSIRRFLKSGPEVGYSVSIRSFGPKVSEKHGRPPEERDSVAEEIHLETT